ncbi:MAG: SpoIIE family protein phosphatase [Chloroflexi bacterium]|jgi:serine phosphatase RsbU (regulator of sigma subunit)|nr:SpoIIE family protein phosphatase [Chloroflexota bacterium]
MHTPLLYTIVKRIYPPIQDLADRERVQTSANVLGALYSAPLAVAGLIWLILLTDFTRFRAEWGMLALIFVLHFVFERLDFYLYVETTPGTYADWSDSLVSLISWSSVLIFGPTALWITVLWLATWSWRRWRRATSDQWQWNVVRNMSFHLMTEIFACLIAVAFYRFWGGAFPLPGLAPRYLWPALGATLIWMLGVAVFWAPLLNFFSQFEGFAWAESWWETWVRFLGVTLVWRVLIDPFAILAAGLYAQNGLVGYLFFASFLVLVGFIGHRLSQTAEQSQLRFRELKKLERLGRDIIRLAPEFSDLPTVLRKNLCNMFPFAHIEICIFPDKTYLHYPDNWPPVDEKIWRWLRLAGSGRVTSPDSHIFSPKSETPWGETLKTKAIIVAPILGVETLEIIGGIYLARYRDTEAIARLLPALQSLAAQVASALRQAEDYRQRLAYHRVEQELAMAGRIQASFLPSELPPIPGWQLAVTLIPARQAAGDFYDVIPLPNGRLAIIVADVADKGMGAALVMALSRTLLRTYALEYHNRPDFVMRVVNRRILQDTDAGLFVTVFYGVLDPMTGELTYCNAGHPPPYLLQSAAEDEDGIQPLTRTGMALGVMQGVSWKRQQVKMKAGDLLAIYTDGIIEAGNDASEFFRRERLEQALQQHVGRPADEVQAEVLTAVRAFGGDLSQRDDITLMMLKALKQETS